jgi:hypothetical protein
MTYLLNSLSMGDGEQMTVGLPDKFVAKLKVSL